jgi:hypothetical protein
MGIFFGWLLFSLVIGFIGSGRSIGFAGAFFLSLFLSPIIGLIITLVSKDKEEVARQNQALKVQQQQAATLHGMQAQQPKRSITDELERLQSLKDKGHLTQMEFERAKEQVLTAFAQA